MNVDLRQLQHLLYLSEELNFGRAAARANLSQSAFTRSIQALESESGLRLFDRGNRYVRVTPAGARAIEHARHLLAGARDLERDLELVKSGEMGEVSIGSGPYASRALLTPLVRSFVARHAGVSVRLNIMQGRRFIIEQLRTETIDFYVGSIGELSGYPDLDVRLLGHVEGGFYVRPGHPLLRRKTVNAADLLTYRLAVVNLSDGARTLIEKATGSKRAIALESDSIPVLVDVTASTDLVLAASRTPLPTARTQSRLRPLTVAGLSDSPQMRNDATLVRRAGRSLTPAGDLFYRKIIEVTSAPDAGLGWFEQATARRARR